MTDRVPHVVIACDRAVRDVYLDPADLARLERIATWEWVHVEGGREFGANRDPEAREAVRARLAEASLVITCHGSPRLDDDLLATAPHVRFIGELEGDRFAYRIDVEASWARGITVVDTTNGSSYPVAEWALGLIIISLRNAGEHFRHMIEPKVHRSRDLTRRTRHGLVDGDLWGKTVGLIGCGHIGRRLIHFLKAFECRVRVHDPYLPREMADAVGYTSTSLRSVMERSDIVVCLAPHTPATEGLIGATELAWLRPNSVFVNVSRGAVVNSQALIERLRPGDVVAGLDVFDPEPIPADSEIKRLPNVFLSPHIATTASTRQAFFRLMVDEVERFLDGHQPLFEVTPRTLANRRGAPA
ncbi:MAG: hydroxyacid dehydrogenase [Chloroflexi bacterium]|jgi:phosphoglycerate dehydrogenase-like enzyme|nr:hydroxyacid dehydrogenase [Chloroflexota bacterium]